MGRLSMSSVAIRFSDGDENKLRRAMLTKKKSNVLG